jgi:hypothetical protein
MTPVDTHGAFIIDDDPSVRAAIQGMAAQIERRKSRDFPYLICHPHLFSKAAGFLPMANGN